MNRRHKIIKKYTENSPPNLVVKIVDHVRTLTPPWPGDKLIPHERYVTTGEFVVKTRYLIKEIKDLKNRAAAFPPQPEFIAFIEECDLALEEAKRLLNYALLARGDHASLETMVRGDEIYCRCVDPKSVRNASPYVVVVSGKLDLETAEKIREESKTMDIEKLVEVYGLQKSLITKIIRGLCYTRKEDLY